MPGMSPPDRTPHWPSLLAILLLAGLVRGILCVQPACISRDGVNIISLARKLADDPVQWMKIETRQPGFSWMLLQTHRLFGQRWGGGLPDAWQFSGRLLALLGGAAVCAGIYLIALQLYDRRIAAVAGLLACFWPQAARLSASVLSDMPHLAMYLAAFLAALVALRRSSLWQPAICGLVAGLAYFVRQEAIGLVAATAFCLLWFGPCKTRSRKALSAAILVVCFSIVIAPYAMTTGRVLGNKGPEDILKLLNQSSHNDRVTPRCSHDRNAAIRAATVRERPAIAERSVASATASLPCGRDSDLARALPDRRDPDLQHRYRAGTTSWHEAPAQLVESWAKSGRYVIAALFLAALFLKTVPQAESRGRRLAAICVMTQVALVLIRIAVFGGTSSRYMIIPAALCIPWAAAAFVTLTVATARHTRHPTTSRTAATWISASLLALMPLAYYITLPLDRGQEQYRQAGQWLRRNAKPDDLVMGHARLDRVMFYADRTYPTATWLMSDEDDSPDRIRQIIDRKNPAWFVDAEGSRRKKGDRGAHFEALRDGSIPRLQRAHTIGPPGRRTHIFRVRRPATSRPSTR